MLWPSRIARRLKTSGARVSARTCGSTPHASMSSAASRLRSALRKVLRRCEKAVVTTCANCGAHREGRLGPDRQACDRRPDPRRGLERARTDVEQLLDRDPRGQHDGQAPIVGSARCRSHACHDFPLQHDVQVVDCRRGCDQSEEQWRRNIVGEVADHRRRPPRSFASSRKSNSRASRSCKVAARASAIVGRRS